MFSSFCIIFAITIFTRALLFSVDRGQIHIAFLKCLVTNVCIYAWKRELYPVCIQGRWIDMILIGVGCFIRVWSVRIHDIQQVYTCTLLTVASILGYQLVTKSSFCSALVLLNLTKDVFWGTVPICLVGINKEILWRLKRNRLARLNAARKVMGRSPLVAYDSDTVQVLTAQYYQSAKLLLSGAVGIAEDLFDAVLRFHMLLFLGWRHTVYMALLYSLCRAVASTLCMKSDWENEMNKRLYYKPICSEKLVCISQHVGESDEESSLLCGICLSNLNAETVTLSCGHEYHEGCVLSLLSHTTSYRKRRCPLCRADMKRYNHITERPAQLPDKLKRIG